MKNNMTKVRSSEMQLTGEASATDKLLYVNLVLVNMFLQRASKDAILKIKGSKLGMDFSV